MARPRNDAHAVATTERILHAAERAFADKGYAATTLAEIARAASIRRPSLLYHFGTKEQLYEAVLERAFDALGADMGAVLQGASSPADRLRAMTNSYSQHLETHPWLPRLVLREMLDQSGGGQASLLARLLPLRDLVVGFVSHACQGALRPEVDLASTVVNLGAAEILRVSAGPLGEGLWPGDTSLSDQAVATLLQENSPNSTS